MEKKQYLCTAFWSAHVRNPRIYAGKKAKTGHIIKIKNKNI